MAVWAAARARATDLAAQAVRFIAGGAGRGQIPRRVQERIVRQQQQSEVLIAWAQLMVFGLYGVAILLAPTSYNDGMVFRGEPALIVAYVAFLGVRIWLFGRGYMSPWFVASSILFDIGLVLYAVWWFAETYGEPPATYLKSPTLLYLFILVGLRGLRFQAAWVLFAGSVALVGVVLLVNNAIYFGPGGDSQTMAVGAAAEPGGSRCLAADPAERPGYCGYLYGGKVLVSAEFDRIVTIGAFTIVLALIITRARNLLIDAIVAASAARDLSRFFDERLADRITRAEGEVMTGTAEIREAAILFFDLRGFTTAARRLAPEQLLGLLGEYHQIVVPIVRRHGGSVDKYMGDGILCSFGAVRPMDDQCAAALRAVDEALAGVAAWRAERADRGLIAPAVGAAVASGPVLFGAIGSADRLEYTVIGDAVNLAAKLEKHNKAEGVVALCDGVTWDRARAQGYPEEREERPNRTVAGVGEPLRVVVLAKS